MSQRAQQHCLATKLNIALGELGYYSLLDLDGDGEGDTWLYEVLQAAEEAFAAGEYEVAKDLCEGINTL